MTAYANTIAVLVLAAAILLIPTLMAARSKFSPIGWAQGWCMLYFMGGSFRLLLEFWPGWAPLVSAILLIVTLAASALASRGRLTLPKSPTRLPIVAFAALILLHNSFPQFDIDSLMYHLTGLEWLHERHGLPLAHQFTENFFPNFRFLALEEFLSIPGLALDHAWFSGCLGGVLKLLSMLSIVSLVPRRWPLLQVLAAFLLVIDDHFFFSGISRFVYLTPSLIGQIPLAVSLAIRGARGHSRSAAWAAVMAYGIAGTKYFGIAFAVGIFGVLIASLFAQKLGLKSLKFKSWFNHLAKPWMIGAKTSGVLLCFAVYGLNWIETGSPVYNMGLGPIQPRYFSASAEWADSNLHRASWMDALQHPVRLMVYSGNLALKAVAVLIFLSVLIGCARMAGTFQRIQRRALENSVALFGVCWIWVVIAWHLQPEESRWLRLVFGVAIAGLAQWAIALRPWIRECLLRFRPAIWQAARGVTFQNSAAAFLVIYALATIDTRYFNVPHYPYRPRWQEIWDYSTADFQSNPQAIREQVLSPLHHSTATFEGARACIAKVSTFNPDLLRGSGLAVYASAFDWPTRDIAPFAIRGDIFSGKLRWPEGVTDPVQAGIRYVLLPKDWKGQERDLKSNREVSLALLQRAARSPVICQTETLELVELTPQ